MTIRFSSVVMTVFDVIKNSQGRQAINIYKQFKCSLRRLNHLSIKVYGGAGKWRRN